MASGEVALSGQDYPITSANAEATRAGVSWPAVFAGAFTMGALALILAVLGGGIGLSFVLRLAVARCDTGLAGFRGRDHMADNRAAYRLFDRRLSRWPFAHKMGFHPYPRGLFPGYGPWFYRLAVALVISTIVFKSFAASIAAKPTLAENAPGNYFFDMLFRTDHPAATRNDQPLRAEAAMILANAASGHEQTGSGLFDESCCGRDRITTPSVRTLAQSKTSSSMQEIAVLLMPFFRSAASSGWYFAIPWEALSFDLSQKVAVLDIDKDRLRNAPGFEKDNGPDVDNASWGSQLYRHYGYEPYWESETRESKQPPSR